MNRLLGGIVLCLVAVSSSGVRSDARRLETVSRAGATKIKYLYDL